MDEHVEIGQLESSLAAVRAVGAAVSAVWALARAQLPRVEQTVTETATYLEWLDAFVDEVAGSPVGVDAGATLTVVCGPERPFCGGLTRTVLRAVPAEGPLILVGTRLAERGADDLAAAGRDVRALVAGAGGVDELGAAADRVARALLEVLAGPSAPARVQLVYPGARQPVRSLLLATQRGAPRGERDLFSPATRVAEAAARESVSGHLRLALTRTLHAEVRMRAASADRARRAAEDREAALATQLRVLERELITAELIELAAGADAGRGPR